ncbi:hypothetical protein [Anabaena subtropica]|uniref:Uncharacterized protein n=1 Tax=Anabaena subtropica FACHB-260 TaxID=2692884 RepID=A0ABR8CPX2_9NOST|nr:hypothetical protein [Anabaena subtropica]MBD2344232.1 hypothetical protein [Anabaena subtropica FACHB-260]
MTTYTLRQANSWFDIEALLNIGAIFAIHSGDDRPISPEPGTDGIIDPLKEIFNPSARPKKKVVDPDADQSTTPAIPPESEF